MLIKQLEKIINSKTQQEQVTEYGVIKSYNSSNHTCNVAIDGVLHTDIRIQSGFIPQIEESVIVINLNNDRIVQPGYNPNYSTNNGFIDILNNQLYETFGNYIKNGKNREAILATYNNTNKQFQINAGEMNIKGSIIKLETYTTFNFDTSTLSAGIYYLIIDDTLTFKVQSNTEFILENEIPLLEINVIDTTNITYKDIRPTTKILNL